jgi:hypothetical protein
MSLLNAWFIIFDGILFIENGKDFISSLKNEYMHL